MKKSTVIKRLGAGVLTATLLSSTLLGSGMSVYATETIKAGTESSAKEETAEAEDLAKLPAMDAAKEAAQSSEEGVTDDKKTSEKESLPENDKENKAEKEKDSVKSQESKVESKTEVKQEEKTAEKSLFADIASDSLLSKKTLTSMDFSTKRLLVAGEDSLILDKENEVGSYEGLHLMQYKNEAMARNAYSYYYGKAAYVDIDSGFSVASGNGEATGTATMTEESNPLTALTNAPNAKTKGTVIALIDTGVNENANVFSAVSMIGGSTSDENGHGTAMAKAIVGVNPDAKILSIKALGSDGKGDASAIYAAMKYAIDNGADIINLSISSKKGAESAAIADAVAQAKSAGIQVVAAAGNNSAPASYFIPGSIEGVLTIGAANADGTRLMTSNYGDCVDYNVVAGSSSEASAIYSGLLSTGKGNADNKLVFPRNYEAVFEGPALKLTYSFLDPKTMNPTDTVGLGMYNDRQTTLENGRFYTPIVFNKNDLSAIESVQVFTGFMKFGTGEEKDITSDCNVDLQNGVVYIPEKYKDADNLAIQVYMSANSYMYGKVVGQENDFMNVDDKYFTVAFNETQMLWDNPYTPTSVIHDSGSVVGQGDINALYVGAEDYSYSGNSGQVFGGESIYSRAGGFSKFTYFNGVQFSMSCCNSQKAGAVGDDISSEIQYIRMKCVSVSGNTAKFFVQMVTGRYGGQDGAAYIKITLTPPNGTLSLTKTSADASLTSGNKCYSLEGAKYGVYRNANCTDKAGEFTTGANGKSTGQLTLKSGTYYVKELSASKGYLLDTRVYTATVTAGKNTDVAVKEQPGSDPVGVSIYKVDAATGENLARYGGSFADAEFTIQYFDAFYKNLGEVGSNTPLRTWVYKTNGNGEFYLQNPSYKISGDELYIRNRWATVPQGTLVIKETKAPAGYLASDETWIVTIKSSADGNIERTFYDANGNKLDLKNNIPVGNAPTIRIDEPVKDPKISTTALDKSTLEHEGFADSDKPIAIVDTVKMEGIVPGQTYVVRGTLMDKKTGKPYLDVEGEKITVERTFTAKAENEEIALAFRVDKEKAAKSEIVVFESLYWVNNADNNTHILRATHNDIEDINQTVTYPKIQTSAKDASTNLHEGNASEVETVTVNDTVKYQALIPGNTYKLIGTLYDKETKKAIVDAQGNPYTGEKTFTAPASSGSEIVSITVPATLVRGKKVVTFEDMYRNNKLIAIHADIKDEEQTVSYPEIHTTATDALSKTHEGLAKDMVTIHDDVAYKALTVGHSYKLTGVLMDKATGKAILDKGKEITSSLTFTAKEEEGTVRVSFKVPSMLVKGKDTVVFETLTMDGKVLAQHKDINDKGQTVTYPEIATRATDGITKEHEGLANETVTIHDDVQYKKLIAGKTYLMTGTLMDKKTNKAILDKDGKPITASKEFKAESRDGSVRITFTVDASLLAGKKTVAFETLSRDKKEVAIHADIEDKEQTVSYPKIRTKVRADKTGEGVSKRSDEMALTDTITYENLIVGQTYQIKTRLMNAKSGEPVSLLVDGKEVLEMTKLFTPETEDGEVAVSMLTSSEHIGKDSKFVVFQNLYTVNEDGTAKDEVARHEDLDDQGQTLYVPEIGTTALDGITNSHEGLAKDKVTVNDTVRYKGLRPGMEYTVSGTLMNKATKKPLLDADGKELISTKTFTPEKEDGSVVITFTLDASLVAGKKVVAFERVDYKDIEVAVHADIEDEDQTVSYPEIHTTALDEKTGTKLVLREKEMKVTDTVIFKNLIPGKKYRLVGTIMDKATGKALKVNGKKVSSAGYFTPDVADGTAKITFTFDGTAYKGNSLVVFESIFAVTEDKDGKEVLKEVAQHKDLKDENQTVYIPSVGTSATVNGGKSAVGNGTVTVRDSVAYKGLVAGKTYKVSGVLMDKATGKAVIVNGKEVVGETIFTPNKGEGTVDVTFTFDATSCQGKSLVVFEKLYIVTTDKEGKRVDKEIGHHEDIQDEAQTITITKPYKSVKTGDEGFDTAKILIIVLLGATGAILLVVFRKRK